MLRRILKRGAPATSRRPLPLKAASAEELRAQAEASGNWMYRFDLGMGVETTPHDEYLEANHQTRWSMIAPELRRTFEGRWGTTRVLDCACNEGWWSFEVAKFGAAEVVGFDARDFSVKRAEFVQANVGAPNVEFRVDNLFDVTQERYGTFDLVLCVGLLYHLEDPMGALRRLRALTSDLCVIETEVARSISSATIERGPIDGLVSSGDVIAVLSEPEFKWNPLSSVTGVALVPSLSALQTMLKLAGFRDVTQAAAPADAVERYVTGDRVVLFARV